MIAGVSIAKKRGVLKEINLDFSLSGIPKILQVPLTSSVTGQISENLLASRGGARILLPSYNALHSQYTLRTSRFEDEISRFFREEKGTYKSIFHQNVSTAIRIKFIFLFITVIIFGRGWGWVKGD